MVELPHHIYEDMDLVVGKGIFLVLKLIMMRANEGSNKAKGG
jgi:hypothetical protein